MSDILTLLLGFKWRDISFPVNTMSMTLEQDLAQHKFYGRDGADVESTGRAPLVFSATIPFRNGVAPGLAESFTVLYPDTYRAMLAAMAEGTTGYLTHPELGDIQCKAQKFDTSWDATKRDGCDVQASWIETTEVDDGLQTALGQGSPIASAGFAAANIDGALRLSAEKLPQQPAYQPTLADTMRGIAGLGDQISLASGRVSGQVDQLKYRADAIDRSFRKNNDPRDFAALQAVSTLKTALRSVGQSLGAGQKKVSYFRVPKDMTFAGLADLIPAKMTDLMRLNPKLLQSPVVPANTAVQYLAT